MKCYLLKNDYNHSGDMDAFFLPFEGEDNFGGNMMYPDDFDTPDKLYLVADFALIPQYDYPLTDSSVPVMSIKMLNVLKNIKSFNYKIIPAVMLDDSYLEDQFTSSGELKPDVPVNMDYVVLQIKEYTDAFNSEQSIYEEEPFFPGEISVDELVLKEPPSGFPPIFRIKEQRDSLFVSQEAKDALEAAGIVGCVFEPVEVTG